MKKLLIKIVIVCVAFVALDQVVGSLLLNLLEKSPDGRYYKTRYSLEEADEEIIILGSSRAEGNYSPVVLEENLGVDVWNAGRGGQGLPFWAAMNSGILARHKPELVIINVENDFLKVQPNDQSYERAAGILRPFYGRHKAVQNFVDLVSDKEGLLLESNLYAFNSSFYYMLRPYLFKGIDGKLEDKGWKPQEGTLVGKDIPERVINEDDEDSLDPEAIRIFEELVTQLRDKGSKVVLTVSPDYNKKVVTTPTLEYLEDMEGVHLLDFSNDEFFTQNPEFYTDPIHLNKQGAMAYSKRLAEELKPILKKGEKLNLAARK
ncbi:SGNH/GDSL hydrolase family protein [Litoribacter populi]|uniref:SGNH/GDSL hydrolase family protein n=1 Tax=Litoribacter populi TaxID=2598460 RepID=UPI0011810069|nr:SGNH/GDSL hydrolase family protein [Litoribacter populi]